MNTFKYQYAAIAIICASLIYPTAVSAMDPDDQGIVRQVPKKVKKSRVQYFNEYPELREKASKNVSKTEKSFIIQKDIDGNPEFNDPR
jgi:hypothetical protein